MKCLKRSLLVLLLASALLADGFVIFPPPSLTPLSVKYHKVNCDIDNGVATTTIDQEFVNNLEDGLTGGRYVFPVPRGAVIDQFKVIVDGEAKTATARKNSPLSAGTYLAIHRVENSKKVRKLVVP